MFFCALFLKRKGKEVMISIGVISLLYIVLCLEFSMENPIILKCVKLVLFIRTALKVKLKPFPSSQSYMAAVFYV